MYRGLAEDHLEDYIAQAWPVLEPTTPYNYNWHIGAIAEYLEACDAGQIRRLVINIPPRHMKSTIVTIDWPTWSWIHNPASRWVFASYSYTLSMQHGRSRRTLLRSPWYRDRWGDRHTVTTDNDNYVQNDKLGHYLATSTNGSITGMGGNKIIVDDPHTPEGAWSDAERETAIRSFDQTLSTRLDDPKSGVIVIVMQRLHERDLTGHVLADVGGYEHLCLPAEAEGRTTITFPSGTQRIREDGELLWPSRIGPNEITEARGQLGSYGYAGQYQQRPAPAGGGIWKRAWFRYWMPATLPQRFDFIIGSVDCTFKGADDSDYVAMGAWGIKGADRYRLDRIHERLSYPDTKRAIRSLVERWPLMRQILVEDKANGSAIIDDMRHEIAGLTPVEPLGGKEARAHAAAPQIEAGNVYLPADAPWLEEYLAEVCSFPNAPNDDEVDETSQLLCYVGLGSPSTLTAPSRPIPTRAVQLDSQRIGARAEGF